MKYYEKKPHAFFYALGLSGLLFFPIALMDDGFKGLGIAATIFGVIFFVIGVVIHIFSVQNKTEENEEQDEPKEQIAEKIERKKILQSNFLSNNYTALDKSVIKSLCNRCKLRCDFSFYYDQYTYTSVDVDFFEDTRVAKLAFSGYKTYKTIERYVQRDHVRYPVYSDTKYTYKTVKKTIKLTNAVLEDRPSSDLFISKSFKNIILSINNPSLVPSWFIREMLGEEKTISSQHYRNQVNELENMATKSIGEHNSKINEYELQKQPCTTELAKLNQKLDKINSKTTKPSKKKDKLSIRIAYLEEIVANIDKNIEFEQSKINEIKSSKQEKLSFYENEYSLAKTTYELLVGEITPLDTTVQNSGKFIALKDLASYGSQKITGCYIIHNRETDKYYVGQSKDVLRRLKQHFKNTVPNNPVFAEDYYTSQWKNKEDLFEFRVIELETKDELDKTEKELIEKYDSFESGYNGTNGNN